MLERYSWTKARERFQETNVAIIPVGATEQHGPQLPLGTDFLTAEALARSAAEVTQTVCTPVIPVGVSSHHLQFWGTLSVSSETLRRYMKETALSVASHGIKRIIFVNGHGGNIPALQEIARELRPQDIFAVVWNWWLDPELIQLFGKLFKSRGSHAGASETSIIWAIDEELVDQSAFDEAVRGASDVFGVVKHGAQLPFDTIDFSQSGATLDPREASKKAGEQILKRAREELVKLIHWLRDAPDEELRLRPHKR